jgi:hypothetical protein
MDFAWGVPVLEYVRAFAPGAFSATGNDAPFQSFLTLPVLVLTTR